VTVEINKPNGEISLVKQDGTYLRL